jgi:MvdC family ATP-grasp ribosomal peptide maturase
MPASGVVLLVTHSGDFYTVDRVAEEIVRRGGAPVRVDTDRFPATLALTAALDADGWRHVLDTGTERVPAEAVIAVWARRLAAPALDDELDPAFRDGCAREAVAAVRGFLGGLTGRRFVNPPDADHAAGDKLRQLRLARELGLEVPPTIVTSAPDEARAFHAAHRGDVVAKMLTPLSTSMDGGSPFVHTSVVTAEDLEHLDGLRFSPMVFQQRIPKARELRVAMVAGRPFAGAIDASRSEHGQVDWRRSLPGEVRWTPGTVPDDVTGRLGRLLEALGLVYGAVDLIVTPDGRHVFLEVNPAGEWGMLERDLELPIAAALADALVGR